MFFKSRIFKFDFRFREAPTSLKMMVLGVASNSQSIGSGSRTVTPIAPELIFIQIERMCENVRKLRNLTHSPSKRSIDLKFPTNALTNISTFDIRLPLSSIFGNADCAYLELGTKYLVLGTKYLVASTKNLVPST